jgi:hypothetical protein
MSKYANDRQKAIQQAINAAVKGGKAVVEQFIATVEDYWNVDKRSTDNLEYLVTHMHVLPVLQKAVITLLPVYAGVAIDKKDGQHEVRNTPTSKRRKEIMLEALAEMREMGLTSLLNHPMLKVKVKRQWTKEAALNAFRKNAKDLLEHGVDLDEVLAVLEAVANEEIEKQDAEAEAIADTLEDVA